MSNIETLLYSTRDYLLSRFLLRLVPMVIAEKKVEIFFLHFIATEASGARVTMFVAE